jgi:hypothetical protein
MTWFRNQQDDRWGGRAKSARRRDRSGDRANHFDMIPIAMPLPYSMQCSL